MKLMTNLNQSKRDSTFLCVFLFAAMSLSFSGKSSEPAPPSQISAQARGPQYIPGEVIIKFKPTTRIQLGKTGRGTLSTGFPALDILFEKFQGQDLKPIFPGHVRPSAPDAVDLTRFFSFRFGDGSDPQKVAGALQRTGVIEYAEPRFIRYLDFTPNDPDYDRQWYLRKIQADKAWDLTKGDTSVVIGIVDTGIDWNHEDLRENIWRNPRPGQNPNFPADSIGWDFGGLNGTPDNNPDEDGPDHGTFIAGLASAATDNNIGVAGVGFRCKIMAVKASRNDVRSNFGAPFILYGYEGMVYAADNGASIINASWGGPGYSRFEQEVVNYVHGKGALVVAAAGNNSNIEPIYPSGYAHVLAVGATDSTDQRSNWGGGFASNFGPHVGVSSPGTGIYNTFKSPRYVELSGTSMSTAIVSGTAALVKSLHATWTPDQVAQQIRVTADPIDGLNPSFPKQLGFGRVNAFRAVSDTSSPGVQMVTFALSDSIGGNNDRSIDPGETIRVLGQFTNFLRPTLNATAELTTSDPSITITNATVALGALGTLETVTNGHSPFVFRVASSIPENHKVIFYVNFRDEAYRDYTGFTVVMNTTFKNHNANNITMTVTSKGALAFNDYPTNLQGTGFIFHPGGNDNLLFEGAFMAGTDVAHVVDVARSENQAVQSRDFIPENRFSFLEPPLISDQDGLSVFTDAAAGENQIGLRTKLETYAFKDPANENYIILKYTLVNRKTTPIANFHVGLYLDWDLGSVTRNIARYDSLHRLGYVLDTDPSGSRTYAGTMLLRPGRAQFRAIANDGDDSWQVYDGFTKAEKWQALSSGIDHPQAGPTDVSFVIGTGPISISGNDSITVGFAVLAGPSLSHLQTTSEAAKAKYDSLSREFATTRIVAFSGEPKRQSILLRWQTSEEINVNGFEIQRRLVSDTLFQTVDFIKSLNTAGLPGSFSYSYEDSLTRSGTYIFRLRQVNLNNSVKFSEEITLVFTFIPDKFALFQNYPNPFNPTTTIRYDLPSGGRVLLTVYNMLGQEVARLVDGLQATGRYEIPFTAGNLSSGIYFYKLQAGSYTETRKMVILR